LTKTKLEGFAKTYPVVELSVPKGCQDVVELAKLQSVEEIYFDKPIIERTAQEVGLETPHFSTGFLCPFKPATSFENDPTIETTTISPETNLPVPLFIFEQTSSLVSGFREIRANDLWNIGVEGENHTIAVLNERDNGHGRGVRDSAAATGTNRDALNNGIARKARILDLEGFGNSGLISIIEDVLRRYQAGENITALTMSIGVSQSVFLEPCNQTPLTEPLADLATLNILIFAGSGNSGRTKTVPHTLWPACVPGIISVGAATIDNTGRVVDGSSTAPFLDFLVPTPSCTSSNASPQAAAAYTLLREAVPNASASKILDALKSSGNQISLRRNFTPDINAVLGDRSSATLEEPIELSYSVPSIDVFAAYKHLTAPKFVAVPLNGQTIIKIK